MGKLNIVHALRKKNSSYEKSGITDTVSFTDSDYCIEMIILGSVLTTLEASSIH
jgi:hypothetical protein